MKKNSIKKLGLSFGTNMAIITLVLGSICAFGVEKAQAATNGFELFNIDLNTLLGSPSSKMADANLDKIPAIILRVTEYALALGGVIAFIMILFSSIMYATSFGDESRAETAKKALTWSIIGIIVVTIFGVIMRTVSYTFNMGL